MHSILELRDRSFSPAQNLVKADIQGIIMNMQVTVTSTIRVWPVFQCMFR